MSQSKPSQVVSEFVQSQYAEFERGVAEGMSGHRERRLRRLGQAATALLDSESFRNQMRLEDLERVERLVCAGVIVIVRDEGKAPIGRAWDAVITEAAQLLGLAIERLPMFAPGAIIRVASEYLYDHG